MQSLGLDFIALLEFEGSQGLVPMASFPNIGQEAILAGSTLDGLPHRDESRTVKAM